MATFLKSANLADLIDIAVFKTLGLVYPELIQGANMKAGDRVQIQIDLPHRWIESAVDMFNGCLGTIKEVKITKDYWERVTDTRVLVQFDEPQFLPQSKCEAFHFDKDDLIVL